MKSRRAAALIMLAIGSVTPGTSADIVYDSLTNHPSFQWLHFGNGEVADDTMLAPGAGLLITSVTVRTREPTSNLTYVGSMRVNVYADQAGVPGALLTTHTVPLTLLPTQTLDVTVDVPDALAPSPAIWTSWFFEFPGISSGSPSATYNGAPSIGSTAPYAARRSGGLGPWTVDTIYNGFAIRVESIPAPGAVLVPSLAAIGFVGRRRR